eukprot:TRINITY_DN13281_c0_g1_i2.p1 TRINITY_DN13281_c0_g1~~TRINITY_DN13281_c0_g1_i2.p1  ORF type:complete len:458 (-),score=91.45 TRINITY_DN13281_c0_g1_i2:307-1680(-)
MGRGAKAVNYRVQNTFVDITPKDLDPVRDRRAWSCEESKVTHKSPILLHQDGPSSCAVPSTPSPFLQPAGDAIMVPPFDPEFGGGLPPAYGDMNFSLTGFDETAMMMGFMQPMMYDPGNGQYLPMLPSYFLPMDGFEGMVGLDGVCPPGPDGTNAVMLDTQASDTTNDINLEQATSPRAAPEASPPVLEPVHEDWAQEGKEGSEDECKLEPTTGKWSDEGKAWNSDDWSIENWEKKDKRGDWWDKHAARDRQGDDAPWREASREGNRREQDKNRKDRRKQQERDPSPDDAAQVASEAPSQHGPVDYTTVMLRNIPNKYTREMLVKQLNQDFRGMFDFLYLPIDFKNKCNVGYGFINFRTFKSCGSFVSKFNGVDVRKCLPGLNSRKIAEVTPARVQGLDENVRRLKNSPVMNELVLHSDWMPLLLDEAGEEVAFPLPDQPCPPVKPRRRGRDERGLQ